LHVDEDGSETTRKVLPTPITVAADSGVVVEHLFLMHA